MVGNIVSVCVYACLRNLVYLSHLFLPSQAVGGGWEYCECVCVCMFKKFCVSVSSVPSLPGSGGWLGIL